MKMKKKTKMHSLLYVIWIFIGCRFADKQKLAAIDDESSIGFLLEAGGMVAQ